MLKWFKRLQTPFQNDFKLHHFYDADPHTGVEYIYEVPEGTYLEILSLQWLAAIRVYTGSTRYHYAYFYHGAIPFLKIPLYGGTPYQYQPTIQLTKCAGFFSYSMNLQRIHKSPLPDGIFLHPHDRIKAFIENYQPNDEIKEFYLTAKAWRVI